MILRITSILFVVTLLTLPVFAQDKDNDSVLDGVDNCADIWNPHQKDLDQDGVGDRCDPTTKIISFSDQTPVGFAHEIDYLFNEDLSLSSLIDPTDTFLIESDSIRLLKPLSYEVKDYYLTKALQTTSSDTLDVIIFVDRTKKDTTITLQQINWLQTNLGPLNIFYSPYRRFESTYYGELNLFSYWFPIAMDECCIVTDIDRDGDQDLVISDTRVNHKGLNLNIHQLSEPVYLLQESSKEFRAHYNDFGNNMLFHTTQTFFEVDINQDERNEIINLGEHYHALVPQWHSFYDLNRSFMRTKGFELGKDYDEDEHKMHRYYSWNESGELKDEVSKILLDGEKPYGFLSHYSATIGDIDLDGDQDYIVFSGVRDAPPVDAVWDVLVNDGNGNFAINRAEESTYYASEGYAHLVDVNGDEYPDLIFGGGVIALRDSSTLGYYLNNQNGHFDMNYQLIDKLHITLGARNIFNTDLDQDGNMELIVYYSTGYGSSGNGLSENDIPNLIRIYEWVNNNFVDVTSQFFEDEAYNMNYFTQTGHMRYFDLDYDGDLDLVPRFHLADPAFGWPSNNGYRGDWNDSKGFQYFAYDPSTQKFLIKDIGALSYDISGGIWIRNLYNRFDFYDLDGDSLYEWISYLDGGFTITDPIYIEPIEDQVENVSVSGGSSGTISIEWSDLEKANQYQIIVFRGDSTIIDTTVANSEFTFSTSDENYYDLKIRGKNILQEGEWSDSFRVLNGQLTSLENTDLPGTFSLTQNYPNPFNPSTTIQYALPEVAVVRLEVFNMLGQSVGVLVDGVQQAGSHTVTFDASGLSTGVYFYRLDAPGFTQARQMLLVK